MLAYGVTPLSGGLMEGSTVVTSSHNDAIVRTRFGSAIISLSFDDNKEYAYMNNFATLMFVTCEVLTNKFCF